METLLPTAEAARRAGVTVSRWHYLVIANGIRPAVSAPGKRGAKFWTHEAVKAVWDIVDAESKAAS